MVSLGCPKNLADGEAMLGLLSGGGYILTPDAGEAEIIIVNTCGFINDAKKESIEAILDMAEKKSTGRCYALIVTGCLSVRFRESFASELPEVDAVLGTGEYGRILETADMLSEKHNLSKNQPVLSAAPQTRAGELSSRGICEKNIHIPGKPRTVHESTPDQRLGHFNANRILTNNSGYVYIKIAEGCDNCCSYCVIPAVRGSYLGRPLSDIIAEVRRVAAGCDMEIVLVAQDTTRYGSEGPRPGTAGLCGLIDELSAIDRVRWIRLMYAYPDRIDERLAELFVKNTKLARYIDMPVQHASDRVLRSMGRRYTRGGLRDVVGMLRRNIPGLILRTTVMTGFPGEDEGDFAGLLDFISETRFERLGVFAYSREEGTPAARMHGQTAKKTAQKRRSELLRVQTGIMAQAEAARVGCEYEALIDSIRMKGGKKTYMVRTYAEAPQIDGAIQITGMAEGGNDISAMPTGSFIRVKVTGRGPNGLTGVLI